MKKFLVESFKDVFKNIKEKDLVCMINAYTKKYYGKDLLIKIDDVRVNYRFAYVDNANDYGYFRIEYDTYNVMGRKQIGAKIITISPDKVMSTELNDEFLTKVFKMYLKRKYKFESKPEKELTK